MLSLCMVDQEMQFLEKIGTMKMTMTKKNSRKAVIGDVIHMSMGMDSQHPSKHARSIPLFCQK